jgi:predicted RNase H-like HicB family nuclease
MCVKFEGKLFKEGRYWPVFISALDIHTQGKTKKDALAMIKDAVELLIDRKVFAVDIVSLPENRFILKAKNVEDDKYLIALMLKNQRAKYGLSTSEVAKRLGVSKNAYAQYEQAHRIPSITKVEEFVHAMSDHVHVVLNVIDDAA